ncbi:retrotransposon protein, putative, ty1-copia subclass [Tanacetum coccineum]|uniref:Retrotransposon protein, putative, ty1-copia subclass n=1 Tax=Tanacetum coccineum TaxID=301880 RepID=A0ABQ4XJ16_9ASTR
MLDTEKFTYNVDMLHDTLHLLVETLENPFVAPVNIQTIEALMKRVGYQGVVDKLSAFYMKNLAQPWQTMFKIPLVSVYTTGNVLIREMLIPDAFLTEEIRATDDFKEYEAVFMNEVAPMNQLKSVVSTQGMHRSTPRAHRTPTLTASPQGKKRKQSVRESNSPQKSLKITIRQQKVVEVEKDDDDSKDRLEPESHKENPKHFDDDDDEEKVDEMKDAEMGSLETRTEEMHTQIPTTPRSPRKILSLDKNIDQELTDTALTLIVTTSKDPLSKGRISSKYSHLLVHPTTTTSTETTSSADLQQQLYLKMKRSLQDQVNDPALWEQLKQDDAPLEGEKRVKIHKASKSSKSAREESVIVEDEAISEDETPELITKLQNIDKHVPTIFDHARIEATLNGALSNQFKNSKEFTLRYENKEYVLDEQIPTIDDDSTQEEIEAHQKHYDDANKVSCIMASSMSLELQKTFENTWAYEMNQQLKEMFQEKASKERLDVVKSLMACNLKPEASICSFVLEMKWYFDRLESLNMVFDAELSINIILSGLPADYNQFVLSSYVECWSQCKEKKDFSFQLQRKGRKRKVRSTSKTERSKRVVTQGLKESRRLKHEELNLVMGNRKITPMTRIRKYELMLKSRVRIDFKDGYKFSFDNENGDILVYSNGCFMFKVSPCKGIYETVECISHNGNVILNVGSSNELNKSKLWHSRLRHVNKKRIAQLQKDEVLESFDFKSDDVCESCLLGR